jgi:hypothetical protein
VPVQPSALGAEPGARKKDKAEADRYQSLIVDLKKKEKPELGEVAEAPAKAGGSSPLSQAFYPGGKKQEA